MEKGKLRNLKTNRGIALSTLVITVIVLLILATITISTISGRTGIFEQTRQAKLESEIKSEIEVVTTAASMAKDEEQYGVVKEEALRTALNTNTGPNKTTVNKDNVDHVNVKYQEKFKDSEKYSYYIVEFTESKRKYLVSTQGFVKFVGNNELLNNSALLLASPLSDLTPKGTQFVSVILKELTEDSTYNLNTLEYAWDKSESEQPSSLTELTPAQKSNIKTNTNDTSETYVDIETSETGTFYLWVKVNDDDGNEIIDHFGPYEVGVTTPTLTVNLNGGRWNKETVIKKDDLVYNTKIDLYAYNNNQDPTHNAYTITLNPNGGTVSQSSISVPVEFDKWTKDETTVGSLDGKVFTFGKDNGTVIAQYKVSNVGELKEPVQDGKVFAGWYKNLGEESEEKITKDYIPSGDEVFTAKWLDIKYALTYDYKTNGGQSATREIDEVGKNAEVILNGESSAKATHSNPEYEFLGWNIDAGAHEVQDKIKVTTEVKVYAIFAKYITVNFVDFNGTTWQKHEERVPIYNNDVSGKIIAPSINNYTNWNPVGWVNGNQTVNAGSEISGISQTTTYYAKYSKEITVSFDVNGANETVNPIRGTVFTVTPEAQGTTPVITPAEIDIPNTNLTKPGMKFTGWKDNKGNDYEKGTKASFTETTTLTAQWEHIESTATFDSNGGTPVSPITKNVGEEIGDLPTSEKEGYDLIGWFTDLEDGTEITEDTPMPEGNPTFYAHWQAKEYEVTFNPNGGTVNPTTKTVTYDSNYGNLPTPTRTGYDFQGWTKDNLFNPQNFYNVGKNDGVSIDGSDIILATVPYQENKTILELACKDNTQYTLSYDYEITSVTSGTEIKTGLRLNYSDDTFIGGLVQVDKVVKGKLGDKGHITITSDSNKTIKSISSSGWAYGGTVRLSNIRLVEGTTEFVTTDTKVTTPANHTLTAAWKAKEVTVNFDANGGTVNPTSKTATYDSNYGTLPTPTRNGYEFLGWNGKNLLNLEVPQGSLSDTTHENTTNRKFIFNTYVTGLSHNNYYSNNSFSNLTISANSITLTAKSGYGVGFPIQAKVNTDYMLSYNAEIISSSSGANTVSSIMFYDIDGNNIRNITTIGTGNKNISFKTPDNAYYVVITFCANGSTNTGVKYSNIQLEEGSTATEYEPYYVTENTKVTRTEEHTLYAQWRRNTFTVTYDVSTNGGTGENQTADVAEGEPINLSATATKNGYEHIGWSTNKDATSGDASIIMPEHDITIYAI